QIKNSDHFVIRVNGSWETVAQFNPSAISPLGIGTVPNVPLHVAVDSGISTIRIQSGNEGAYGSPFADLSHDGASFFFTNWAEGNVAFTAARPGSSVAFGAGGAVRLRIDQAALFPESDVGLSLGNSQKRWSQIWCNSGIVQTSDRRDKEIIGTLPRSAETIVDSVTPAIFAWKNDKKIGRKKELNVGFIAQELAACLKESGLSVAVCGISEEEKDGGRYWVKPDQILALLWHSLKITRERLLNIEKEIIERRK
ncbi:MAG: tail fiber domain-containing protein, partial [Nitratireductor sp.]